MQFALYRVRGEEMAFTQVVQVHIPPCTHTYVYVPESFIIQQEDMPILRELTTEELLNGKLM